MNRVADILTTQRLRLRKPQAGDLPAYTAFCASARSHFVGGPYDAVRAFEKLATMIGHWDIRGFGRYVIERAGAPIGHVGPLAIESVSPPELTWSLWSETAEGHGYATEAAQAVSKHLFDDCGWQELTILVQPDNHGSVQVAKRLGATLTDRAAPDWYPGALTFGLKGPVAA